ncbi:MFS transporter [Apilactobacillus micheneri]|uniref:MFS transporter n=1 Tax=Apilactobacillus micheneri TaxID=1899430 RepID=A0A9Q8IMC9_9LACO|nr:MFS transporter [Apilactobacillus micheneri]TPR39999.1 MFS transporter [Apilactobacillus micheneri]TPR41810.1 MFS transporter [Apilactobacillus micheneri]TPR44201.1 MFS transporter [Apilactobacillus micheneri]TPR45825.1 MFS transporter [Apilactobacillus micheneri]TPR50569.1 MFS transporter [Apilactobacillus micheneri]
MKERISTNVLLAIIAVGVMTFSGVTVETSMNITFPTLISEFHIGLNVVQWITTIYLLVLSSVIPLSKFLKERFKTSHLFICASILFLIGLVVDAMAPEFIFLLLGRLIQGIGTGIALPLMFNIILENVPKSRLGFMMGFGSLITAAASAVGPTFGGIIVNTLGWRYIFIILIPILVLAFILGIISVPKLPQSELSNNKFDVFSFILIFLTFAGLIFGISNISSKPLLSVNVILPIIIGIIALTMFIKIQNRKEEPILNVKILKNLAYSKYVIAFFINQLIILGLSFIVPNYVQIINHSSSSIAGLILLPGAVVGAIISPFSGSLLDHLGAKKPILTGIGAIVISLLYLAATSYNLSDTIFTIFYTIIMIGIGLSYGNIMTKGLDYLAADIKADGNAILTTVQQFAGAIGTVIVSTIITKITAISGTNNVIGYTFAILFLAILSIIQFLVVFSTKE